MPRRKTSTLEEAKSMTQEEINDFVRNHDATRLMCPHEEEDCDPWTMD